MSHIKASQIDIVEVHDAFTILEIIAYEDIGFAKKGEGRKFVNQQEIMINSEGRYNWVWASCWCDWRSAGCRDRISSLLEKLEKGASKGLQDGTRTGWTWQRAHLPQ